MLEVRSIGSEVLIGDKVTARVTSVCISGNTHITYQCSWWDGSNHNCKWLEEFEVSDKNGHSGLMSIGFIPPQPQR